MAPSSRTSLAFKVHRRQPELITPAKPTPREFKPLSDIDDHEGLRFHIPIIQVYRHNLSMQGKDPVVIIRKAIAETLVFYYPFAGRLRELDSSRKLIVECTGEGILFIEADANVTFDESRDLLQPPFPCLEELLFDVPGSSGILNSPLLLIQVTRLKCGGFVFALRLNHTMSDAPGLAQFMTAIAEMARGKQVPSVLPVWERHIINARNPLQVKYIHREYDDEVKTNSLLSLDNDLVDRAFFIKFSQISTLIRRTVPSHLHDYTKFEILTACLWKCRTIALQPYPKQEMHIIFMNNVRRKFNPPLLPEGYYGNGFVILAAVTTAKELCENPVSYTIELIRKAKVDMSREYLQSVVDLMVIRGRPDPVTEGAYGISDVRHVGFREVDLGWGKAVYGGPAKAILDGSFYVPFENEKGENGILLLICLPAQAIQRFAKELNNLLQDQSIGSRL